MRIMHCSIVICVGIVLLLSLLSNALPSHSSSSSSSSSPSLQPLKGSRSKSKGVHSGGTENQHHDQTLDSNGHNSLLGPASSRLSDSVNDQKYNRWQSINKGIKGEKGQFIENRKVIVALNDKHGTKNNPTPFKSTGPYAALHPSEFKKRYLNTVHHSKRKHHTSPFLLPNKKKIVTKGKNLSLLKEFKRSAQNTVPTSHKNVKGRSLLEQDDSEELNDSIDNDNSMDVIEMEIESQGDGDRVGVAGSGVTRSGMTGKLKTNMKMLIFCVIIMIY
jgi:hypothetical protein